MAGLRRSPAFHAKRRFLTRRRRSWTLVSGRPVVVEGRPAARSFAKRASFPGHRASTQNSQSKIAAPFPLAGWQLVRYVVWRGSL